MVAVSGVTCAGWRRFWSASKRNRLATASGLSAGAVLLLLLLSPLYYFYVYVPAAVLLAIPDPPPLNDPTLAVDDSLARELQQRSRLFCWANSLEDRLHTSLRAINDTWVRRCDDHLYFIESRTSLSHDVLALGVPDGRRYLTDKSTRAWKLLYGRKLQDFDWFLQGDEDTYVVVENLRLLLSHYNASQPVWIGFVYSHAIKEGFMSGGASYVLSREAVRLLVEEGYGKNLPGCPQTGGHADDMNLGVCLAALGVPLANTLDRLGRHTFHTHSAHNYVSGDPFRKLGGGWFPQVVGPQCCSQLSVSFHYLTPNEIRLLDFLLYRVTVYGREPRMEQLRELLGPATLAPPRPSRPRG